MSATGRGGARIESDRYMTPPRLAQFLVDSLVRNYPPAARPLRVCEPHAGDGAFVQALRKALPAAHITANDAVDGVSRWYELGADSARVGDFLGLRGEFDLIVGNPPYAVAASIEITRLEETNKKVRENAARADIEEQLESARAETARLDGEIDQCDAEKAEAMAAASFPVQGLSFRENDGSLLLNGLPLEQAAESQRIRLSVAIGFALNPRLKVLLVRQGSELDSNAMRLLAEIADEHGGQVWVERVSEDGAGCSVVLEDGEVRAEPARAAE